MNAKLKERIEDNCNAVDLESAYREMLDENYSFKSVGGPFESMQPSEVFEDVDPTAFRCGLVDFTDAASRDGLATLDNGDTYYQRTDCERERDELVSEIEGEITDLDATSDTVKDSTELETKIEALRDEVKEIESEGFSD